MEANNTLYHVKEGYMVEDIAGKYVLMAPAIGDIDYSKMLVLSESAALVVNHMITDSLDFATLTKLVLNEYNVEQDVVKEELTTLISELKRLNVLEN